MVEQSVLKPVDASTLPDYEAEGKAPWIVRELAGSMTGRVMMASYETIKATGKSVVCLSPWGDSSPLLLPCIRFRDLVATSITVGTVVNWVLVDKPLDDLLRNHARILDGNSAKEVLITLKYKHVTKDAALGFFRSPEHEDSSILSKVADYFAVENGWFSPYLFASGRRPVIPRSIQADVVFAHGPFLSGDYKVAETLLAESAFALHFCMPPDEQKTSTQDTVGTTDPDAELEPPESKSTSLKAQTKRLGKKLLNKDASSEGMPTGGSESAGRQPAVQANAPSDVGRTDFDPLAESATSTGTSLPSRRMIILPLGIKPHRARAWTSSARPGESVMRYLLFNGQCPCVVVPVKPESPLVAWYTSTLSQLGKIGKGDGVEGVVRILLEYVELCVDWERMVVVSNGRSEPGGEVDGLKRNAVRDALTMLVGNLVEAGQSQDVKKESRCGSSGDCVLPTSVVWFSTCSAGSNISPHLYSH